MVFGFYCNFSPLCFITVGKYESGNCELGYKPVSDNLTHGRMVMPSGHPESVAIYLPWSVEGQCVNNNAVWLPGSLDHNLSVQYTVWFSSLREDEVPVWEPMPGPVDMGCRRIQILWDRQQIEYGSFCYHTHTQALTSLTHTQTHEHCWIASHAQYEWWNYSVPIYEDIALVVLNTNVSCFHELFLFVVYAPLGSSLHPDVRGLSLPSSPSCTPSTNTVLCSGSSEANLNIPLNINLKSSLNSNYHTAFSSSTGLSTPFSLLLSDMQDTIQNTDRTAETWMHNAHVSLWTYVPWRRVEVLSHHYCPKLQIVWQENSWQIVLAEEVRTVAQLFLHEHVLKLH